jgi:hypothetical protein
MDPKAAQSESGDVGDLAVAVYSASLQDGAGDYSALRTGVCVIVPAGCVDHPGVWLCALSVSGLPSPRADHSRMPFVLTTPGGQPVPLLGKPAAIPRRISVPMSERSITLVLSSQQRQ